MGRFSNPRGLDAALAEKLATLESFVRDTAPAAPPEEIRETTPEAGDKQERPRVLERPRAVESPPLVPEPPQPQLSPLLSDRLLDAKVRLHRRLIEETNLSALEK